ncbi:tetratricopeptide repeat protein [Seonamhaeicola aphaedonensis]|uniref:TPR repeat protein n=1 Tax=Seonamhaeicola aphaedonensis TaxID=1461338 RepID=A0A3D9HH19_9FLAO|nr:tetratricopeptide repeat protein [Seonamhaeicola aphaedonensis]RED48797.1 TPR repeat protein [Seonamhaeicola aphaedonensis]
MKHLLIILFIITIKIGFSQSQKSSYSLSLKEIHKEVNTIAYIPDSISVKTFHFNFQNYKFNVKQSSVKESTWYNDETLSITILDPRKISSEIIIKDKSIVGDISVLYNENSIYLYFEHFTMGATAGPMAGHGFLYTFTLFDILENKHYELIYKGRGDFSDPMVYKGEFIIDHLINHPKILSFLYIKSIHSKNIHDSKYSVKSNLENGDPEFLLALAKIYHNGRYTAKNHEDALHWYTKSAEQGNADAQLALGWMHYYGEGVYQDKEKALKLFNKSANKDNYEAQNALGQIYYRGEVVQKDYNKAFYWFDKSASHGYYLGENNLGLMYQYGHGTLTDKKKAIYWYRKSANKGCKIAQHNLATMYYNGDGILIDKEKAFELFKYNAERNYMASQFNLGLMYFRGEGTEVNKSLSAHWIRKAYENGNKEAKNFWEEFELWKYDN